MVVEKKTIVACSVIDKVNRCLNNIETSYHRLVLLVGECGSGKTEIIRKLARDYQVPVVNVSMELSLALLELPSSKRAIRLQKLLDDIVAEHIEGQQSPLLFLDNIDLLFEKQLHQDPLRLLQGLSRNCRVLASWNGIMLNGRLIHDEAGSQEYCCYDAPDALIVNMGSAHPRL